MKEQRRNILKIAAKLFHKQGYLGTTLQSIARELDMEAPSLYNHINSKQEILSSLCLHVADKFVEGIDQIKSADLSPLEQLKRIIRLHVNLSYQFPDTMSLMRSEYIHLDEVDKVYFLKQRNDYEAKFRSILLSCKQNNHLTSANVELVMFSLLSTLRSINAWINRYKSYNALQLEEELVDILLDGILVK